MTRQEYLDEHGNDPPWDGVREAKVLGECEYCGYEVTDDELCYSGPEPVYICGRRCGQRKLWLHDDCIEGYVCENVTHEQLAEFLKLERN